MPDDQQPEGPEGNDQGRAWRGLALALDAIGVVDPRLARRLRRGGADAHLVRHGERLCQKVGAAELDLALPEATRVELARGLPPEGEVRLLGLGMGELVEAGLTAGLRVLVWEEDIALIWEVLDRHVWHTALRSGQLTLLVGPDLLQFRGDGRGAWLVHPLAPRLHHRALQALGRPESAPLAMLCAGGLFVDDLGDALVQRGYCVWRLEAERLAEEDTAAILARFRPALVARINTMQGLADLCERARVPLLVWEIDPVLDGLQAPRRPVPGTWIFTYREQQVRTYRSMGYAHVEHLPLAAPPHRRPLSAEELGDSRYLPEDGQGFEAPVSFVGSSMLRQVEGYVSRVKECLCTYLARRGKPPNQAGVLLQKAMEIQRKELDRWVIPGILDASLPGFRDFVRQTQNGIDPAMWLGELVAAERRLSHVRALAPFGVHVWGDPGWGRIGGGGVHYRGYAGHRHQLGRIYCSARVNVDIGRLYQQDIVTMRVFDVLACGGFLLAEHSPHLSKLFEIGRELVVWRNQAELVAKVAYFLRNPEEARAIAEAGRARVLADHQIGQRVDGMLAKMGLSSWEAGGTTLNLSAEGPHGRGD